MVCGSKYGFGRRGKIQALAVKLTSNWASFCRPEDFTCEDWLTFFGNVESVPPPILDQCPWDKFDGYIWGKFLESEKTKKYANRCPWEKFDVKGWLEILLLSPETIGEHTAHCPWKEFKEDDWRQLLYFSKDYRNEFEAYSGLRYEDLHLDQWEPDWFGLECDDMASLYKQVLKGK